MVEWVIGFASAALVAVLIGFLIYRAAIGDDRPAQLEVIVEGIDATDQGDVLRITVANRGDAAATGVVVSATDRSAGDEAVAREITFDLLAARSVRRGAFLFAGPIRPDDVTVVIEGYTEP